MISHIVETEQDNRIDSLCTLLSDKFDLNTISALLVAHEIGRDIDWLLRTGRARDVRQAFEKTFKLLLQVFSGTNASEVVAHYGCLQFTEVAGSYRKKMKLANALSRVCPVEGEARFVSDFATVYAALDSLIFEEGVKAWQLITNDPQVFAVVAKLSVENCSRAGTRDVYVASRFFLRRRFNIKHFRLLTERIGVDRLNELVELFRDQLIDNSILHEFRRSPQIVTERTRIGLRCILVDYRNDNRPVPLRQYIEHYTPNIGYQPPVKQSAPPAVAQTSVTKATRGPSRRRRAKVKTRPNQPSVPEVVAASTDSVDLPDLSTLHKDLDLSGLLPQGVSQTAVQAILVHGFVRPTEERSFRGGRRLSYEILKRFVRNKVSVRSRKFDRALEWLRKQGVVGIDRKSYKLQPISEASDIGKDVLHRLNDLSV